MTKPARLALTMKQGGTRGLRFPKSDNGRDHLNHTKGHIAQSDMTSTLFNQQPLQLRACPWQLAPRHYPCPGSGGSLRVRWGEGCHMIGSPSGELLKKPPQQSGQGRALVLMPKGREEGGGAGNEIRERGGSAVVETPPYIQQS